MRLIAELRGEAVSQPRELAVYHQPDNQARCAGRDHRAIDSTVRNHAHITSFKDHSRATMCTVQQAVEPTYRCALYSRRDNFHVSDIHQQSSQHFIY